MKRQGTRKLSGAASSLLLRVALTQSADMTLGGWLTDIEYVIVSEKSD